MKRKDYAISLGLAKPGRGRMNQAARDAVDKAIAEGMVFDDMEKHTKAAPVTKRTAAPRVSQPKVVNLQSETSAGVEVERPQTFPGAFWTYKNDKGKNVVVNGIQVCTHCRHSLYWHWCNNPSAVTADGIQNLEVHLGKGEV